MNDALFLNDFVDAVKTMLQKQSEYFETPKDTPSTKLKKLIACKQAEKRVKQLVKRYEQEIENEVYPDLFK